MLLTLRQLDKRVVVKWREFRAWKKDLSVPRMHLVYSLKGIRMQCSNDNIQGLTPGCSNAVGLTWRAVLRMSHLRRTEKAHCLRRYSMAMLATKTKMGETCAVARPCLLPCQFRNVSCSLSISRYQYTLQFCTNTREKDSKRSCQKHAKIDPTFLSW